MNDSHQIEARARIVAVRDGQVRVRGERRSGCGGCSDASCGASTIASALPSAQPLEMTLDDPIGLHPGETVVLGVGAGRVLLLALVAYLFPILMMVLSAAVAANVGASSPNQILAAIVGLTVALVLARVWMRRRGAYAKPEILARKGSI
ncbi:SoxR reducing system RseC family protein [Varunaivibrio sulfuroxidans]|uniref:RseC/MucC-like positive regulator of sigma(E) n=1 Tax=Varunaivibrio sulfuroxidans TaxID=1773489 RepID=A0A4R3J8E2_9PROT|nr:SoxR reducing system RseC family protein [Varunaivibrio sulfuroxidans]TCS61752.1 RseC/MucC-like positive regulator of sigma(E) [Varunaivibrio sulfuroxidans]WES32064.1 SoxR reducing system RseC family protein [Varunaivibrio sulfuroxidans]